jgi:hypothetical protein
VVGDALAEAEVDAGPEDGADADGELDGALDGGLELPLLPQAAMAMPAAAPRAGTSRK